MRTFVDPCPIELGRDAAMMKEISERSEMRTSVVCTTGLLFRGDGTAGLLARQNGGGNRRAVYPRDHAAWIGGAPPACVRARLRSRPASRSPHWIPIPQRAGSALRKDESTGVPIITHTQDGHGRGTRATGSCLQPAACRRLISASSDIAAATPIRRIIGASSMGDRISVSTVSDCCGSSRTNAACKDNLVCGWCAVAIVRADHDEPGSALWLAGQARPPAFSAAGTGAYRRPTQRSDNWPLLAVHLSIHRFRSDAEKGARACRSSRDRFDPAG